MTENKEVAKAQPQKTPLQAGGKIAGIVPQTLDDAWRLTDAFMHAGMVPSSYEGKNPDETRAKLMMGIMQGMELGIPPLTAIKNIAIINNRPTLWGDLTVALVQESGTLAKIEVEWDAPPKGDLSDWDDDFGVTIRLHRKEQDEPYVGRFTVGDARRAKLWLNPRRDPWMKYPKRMMHWRAMGFAIRDGFADCLAGMQIREEVEDQPAQESDRKASMVFLEDDPTAALPAPETPEEAPEAEVEEITPEATEPAPCAPEKGAEGITSQPPKETPQEHAQRMAQRARRKLTECETSKDIDAAYRMYCEGACELLRGAGLNDEADRLERAYSDASAELAAA
ncbi:MAG: hypothetical protein VX464_20865 [Pseudomonadota bacterium]|nr:hypothetical protein [Pseudomonadota bacterium]